MIIRFPPTIGATFRGDNGRIYSIMRQEGRPGHRGITYRVTDGTQMSAALLKLPNLRPNTPRALVMARAAEIEADFSRELAASQRLATSAIASRVPLVRYVGNAQFDVGLAAPVRLPYLVRGHLDAVALDHWLEDQRAKAGEPLSASKWASVSARLCELVAAMHSRFVGHGDIRPGNVRVNTAGPDHFVGLIDFGQSWIFD